MKNLSESAKNEVREAFKANPSVDQFHVTTDGLCFENEDAALNHGQSLTHRLVSDEKSGLRKLDANEKHAVREVVLVERGDLDKKVKATAEKIIPPAKTTKEMVEEETITHVLSEEDIENNSPDLTDAGLKAGDEIEIPVSGKAVDAVAKSATKKTSKKTSKKSAKKTK